MKLMSVTETAEKIKSMEIRGAGRIARAAAEALRDHALSVRAPNIAAFRQEMERAAAMLVATRPTAVSLPNAVHIVMAGLEQAATTEEAREGLVRRAERFIQSSQHAVEKICRVRRPPYPGRGHDPHALQLGSGARVHHRSPPERQGDRGLCNGSAARETRGSSRSGP